MFLCSHRERERESVLSLPQDLRELRPGLPQRFRAMLLNIVEVAAALNNRLRPHADWESEFCEKQIKTPILPNSFLSTLVHG